MRGQVLEVADGQQALNIVAQHCRATTPPGPLFVLLDLQMPVLDGLEFLERQRQLPLTCQQALTVVVVSAAHETRERERVRAVEVKTKPLDVTELAALLQHYLPQALPAAS